MNDGEFHLLSLTVYKTANHVVNSLEDQMVNWLIKSERPDIPGTIDVSDSDFNLNNDS